MSVPVSRLACRLTPCVPTYALLSETVCMVMMLRLLRRAAGSRHAALYCEPHQFGGRAYAKLVAHDRRGVGDGLVGGMDQPRDFGEALADAEQAQDLHLARGQLGKRA